MNSLQQKEFELLKVFTEICEKLNLKYYLVCGSALGAAKYGGFIPWDDDIDVALCRDDYEKFLTDAPRFLPDNLFLQNFKTERNFPQIFTKLRDSSTTYIEKNKINLPINQGVFIDIFPLDGYPDNKSEIKRFDRKKSDLLRKSYCALKVKRSLKSLPHYLLYRFLGYHKKTKRILTELEMLFLRYPPDKSNLWCNHGNWQGKLEYAPREQYGEGAWAEFEGLKVRIPEKYDEYLTQKYGDWRVDLPPEQQVGHHYYEVCDLEKPYTEYMKNI